MNKYIIPLLLLLSICLPSFGLDKTIIEPIDSAKIDSTKIDSTEAEEAFDWEPNAQDGYYIELMNVDVTVHADRTYDIVEDIYANFVKPRHGIVREIPKRFYMNRDVSEAQDRSKYELKRTEEKFGYIEVPEEEFTVENHAEIKAVKIGSPDVWVEGKHHYQIRYQLKLPNDRVLASDLFYHSIVGTAWYCSMDSVHFVVHFDKEVPDASWDKLKIYVGEEGANDDRAHDLIDFADYHTIEGSVTCLPALWGVTIDLPLPEGYFPTDDYNTVYYYLALATSAITILFLIILLFRELQGDEKVASVVTFRPRKDLTSADIGSLVDGEVDDEDLLSMIPWFAAHGHISIENDGKKTVLHKLKPLPADAPEYQTILFTAFFAKGDSFDVSNSSTAFGAAWERAKKALKKQYDGKLNRFESLGLLVLSTFTLSLTYCFSEVDSDGWIVGGLINVILAILIMAAYRARSFLKDRIHFTTFFLGITSLWKLIVTVFGLFIAITMALSAHTAAGDNYLPDQLLFGMMVAMLVVIIFLRRLYRMTAYRRERLAEILGLKEFIQTAEVNRLRMLVDEDERYFYDILPYAMAFGLVDEWAAKFENLSVKELQEFGNTPISLISHCVNKSQWTSNIATSVTNYKSASGGSSGRAGGSRGGYSGGGSGGGGGHSW